MKKRIETKSNKSKRWLWIVTIFFAIVLAGSMLISMNSKSILNHNLAKASDNVTIERLKKENKDEKKKAAEYDFKLVKPLSAIGSLGMGRSSTYYHTGIIKIPAAHVRALINKGMNSKGLYSAVGEAKPGQVMGQQNFALGGHNNYNYAKNGYLFSTLNQVKKGDSIYITDGSSVFEYETNEIKVISYKDGEIIRNDQVKGNQPIITLFTCWSPNHENHPKLRLMVRGKLIKTTKVNGKF